MSYKNNIVNKPWGYEYLVYENENVGLWYLHIEKEQRTSMHCHPKKNTGLVLLKGSARTSFLNNSVKMTSLKKIMIRRGLFHSTMGISEGGASIFEIEAPKDKADLVRLEDSYGRKLSPYEGKNKEVPKGEECLWITDPAEGEVNSYSFCDCTMTTENIINKEQLYNRNDDDIFIFLRGGLRTKEDDQIAQPGDVLDGLTLDKLSRVFEITDKVVLLSIGANNGDS